MAQATYTSALASTSQSAEASTAPSHPTATTASLIGILCEFLQCLIEWMDESTACLTKVENHLSMLYV